MKPFVTSLRPLAWLIPLMFCLLLVSSCKKEDTAPTTYPADVALSWINLQLKLTKTTSASPTVFPRRFAYSGIALYESIVPGLTGYQSLVGQINTMPAMPAPTAGLSYHWLASANAALAAINRSLYPTTSAANKATIDSLEAAYNTLYQSQVSADEFNRSVAFGKQVAITLADWCKTDGYDNATPYTPPTGAGFWVPTPAGLAPAVLPNWGACRLLVTGSGDGADQGAPLAYSEDPASPYYAGAKEVYDLSLNATADQKATTIFWADNPDGKSFISGHWLSILSQTLTKEKPNLDVAAAAYAQMGIAQSEAAISCWKSKYVYHTLRPITYIRSVMAHNDWLPLLVNTPAHSEYPSGHAVLSSAAAQTLTYLFGPNYAFTDHSYDSIGLTARSFPSFEAAAINAGDSRVFGGIHYRSTCDISQKQGKKVAENVNKLKFKK
jgi:hypothetical protein